MQNIISAIAQNFNINPISIYKCKYYYVVNSSKGIFLLSAARPSRERLEVIHRCKEELVNNGFYLLDSYLQSRDGKPYCEYEGTVYTMNKYFGGNELDIMSNVQCKIALETIGSLARAARHIQNELVLAAELENPIMRRYEKDIHKLVKSSRRLSLNKEFDIRLSKYAALAIKKAYDSFESLLSLDYGKKITPCHNSLKEGNIVYNKGKCWIIDWDNMRYKHYLEDCAYFIKRYIRKNAFYTQNTTAKAMPLDELLKHLSKGLHPDKDDMSILIELLSYPHRFISLVNEYCSKNRGFIPSGLAAKLNECMAEWDFFYDYIAINKDKALRA